MRKGIVLGLLIALIPSTARGDFNDYREWLNQCAPGSFMPCASVGLGLHYQAELFGGLGGTTVGAWFQNLQGTAGIPDPGPYTVHSIGFKGLVTEGLSTNIDETYIDPFRHWTEGAAYNPGHFQGGVDGDRVGFGAHLADAPYGEIWGCDRPGDFFPTVPIAAMGWTCGGRIALEHTFQGRIALTDDAYATIGGYRYSGDVLNVTSWSCVTGTTCVNVPEPGAYLLMLSGLLGIGFVAHRRVGLTNTP